MDGMVQKKFSKSKILCFNKKKENQDPYWYVVHQNFLFVQERDSESFVFTLEKHFYFLI